MALWDKLNTRGRVEDRRGVGPAAGGIGITGIALVLLFNLLSGGNIGDVLPELGNALIQSTNTYTQKDFAGEDSYEQFASVVVGSNNEMWEKIFAEKSLSYEEPTLVLFRGSTQSACGGAASYIGPHYCFSDRTIYLDETFFNEMERVLGAKGGDVAQAYVIAHEMGHHVQNELGMMEGVKEDEISNEDSVRLELQADCFAGLWAYSIRELGVFEPGEINEAIDAAGAVGDDRIQERSTGRVNPEEWTHGSSAQRVEWFNKGFESGNLAVCDTSNQ